MNDGNGTGVRPAASDTGRIGAAMVVGAGIGGIQASLDLAESGFKVYLVEKSSAIGGIMTQLDKTFPTNDCAMCIVSPKLVDCARHPNIRLFTCSEVADVSGNPGAFTVRVRTNPRYVDPAKCSGCGECAKVCPVERPSLFDMGLATRKAIYRPFPQATPSAFAIEKLGKSPCSAACPAGCNAHGYVALIRQRKFREAIDLIRQRIPLPGICGRVCGFCEDACNRANVDDPIQIRALKRFAADWELTHAADGGTGLAEARAAVAGAADPPPNGGASVAIIGSGPSGLTAAYDLARSGHQPVIFEAAPRTGGMLRVGIPTYRVPDEILDHEIDMIARAGVEIRTGTPLGAGLTLEGLFEQGFRAVYLAVGLQASHRLGVPGEDLEGVIPGLEFLRRAYEAPDSIDLSGKTVAVIGGGNTAMDAVRTAIRLGAKKAMVLYRRSRDQMPVSLEELEAAEDEGAELHYLLSPASITGREGRVSGIVCSRMRLGRPDSSGRLRPEPVEGTTECFAVDVVIPALGQTIDPRLLDGGAQQLRRKRDLLAVDPLTLETGMAGVFAGGDAVGSGGLVVHAVAHGHAAAVSIDRYVRGKDLRDGREETTVVTAPMPPAAGRTRPSAGVPTLEIGERSARSANGARAFAEVERGLDEEQAVAEAGRCLDCGVCCECLQCVAACEAKAIDHGMKETYTEVQVGSILLAPGCTLPEAGRMHKLGYGRFANVVTSLQFERILSASGPFSGHIQRLSDGREPREVAFIQCVGSRDETAGYCSSVCCMYALKEAIIAKEHDPRINCTIFYMDIRAYGKGFDSFYERAKELGVRFVRCRPSGVEQIGQTGNLRVGYVDEGGDWAQRDFDLVVLSAGFRPSPESGEVARTFQIATDRYGFAAAQAFDSVATNREGIFALGSFTEPKDIPETVVQASSASSGAMCYLASVRGREVVERKLPPEHDTNGEPPRIGVFVCHCGKNIGGYVDVPSVAEYAKSLPHVVYATDNLYTCSSDTQDAMKQQIREHGLNRVVVASCTPRTHEPLFQETIREAGLNPHLFEMANIRDQCSWVHMTQREAATRKSKDLVRMAVAKVALTEPLRSISLPVTPRAMVVGGGLAGMTAALAIADQGFQVYLVEKDRVLGGHARRLGADLEGRDVGAYVEGLSRRIERHELIKVYTGTTIKKVAGFIGNFVTTIERSNGQGPLSTDLEHGVAVIATGGAESRPAEYLLGESPAVTTLLELQPRLGDAAWSPPDSVVFLQCVGSREPGHQYCSRLCCSGAIRSALLIKRRNPDCRIYVLYRDLRSYGFREHDYELARREGIQFIRYEPERKPTVRAKGERLLLGVTDPILGRDLEIDAGLLVLSTRIDANPDNAALSQLFKVPLNADHFFLEAHVKLRPVEFATDGVYLCGLAHYPKDLGESITQARAAAGRAATVLSKATVDAAGKVSYVNESRCSGCGTCVTVCAYNAITLDADRGVAVINEAVCKGCGACAATCRGSAIALRGFRDEQILSMLQVV